MFFGVNFILQKFCQCKKNDKYQVWPYNEEEETHNTILLKIQIQTQTQIHIQTQIQIQIQTQIHKQTQIQKRKVAANLVRGWGEGQYKARNHH